MDIEDRLGEFGDRLQQDPDAALGDSNYLSRYENESGELDGEEISYHGLNRVLYALDALSGEDEKPVYVHALTGIMEIALGETLDKE